MKEPPKQGDLLLVEYSDTDRSGRFPEYKCLLYGQETHVVLYLGVKSVMSLFANEQQMRLGLAANGDIVVLYIDDIEKRSEKIQ